MEIRPKVKIPGYTLGPDFLFIVIFPEPSVFSLSTLPNLFASFLFLIIRKGLQRWLSSVRSAPWFILLYFYLLRLLARYLRLIVAYASSSFIRFEVWRR